MIDTNKTVWTLLKPPLRSAASRQVFVAHARSLARAQKVLDNGIALIRRRNDFAEVARALGYVDKQTLLAAGLILSDLAIQGWRIRVRNECAYVCPPLIESENRAAEKARIRRQELVKRDAQLRQPSVQAFLRSMERSRLFDNKFVSIFSLMRDGRELADKLRAVCLHPAGDTDEALKEVIDPYIDFVKSEASRCPHTGLRLMDIWRYFRHNWSNQYTSVPGRSMLFMVRDRAAPLHPVIGIGALCSPIMQLRERDEWIGWQPEAFLAHVRTKPSEKLVKWLVGTLDEAISELYITDFIERKILSVRDLIEPGEDAISRLLAEGLEQREAHHRFARQREHKRPRSNVEDGWVERARSHLFRSKRALALASYLRIRAVLKEAGKGQLTPERLAALAASSRGADAVKKILRKAKADRVGICVADISVCGAVQPYNAILGGKLVKSPRITSSPGAHSRPEARGCCCSLGASPSTTRITACICQPTSMHDWLLTLTPLSIAAFIRTFITLRSIRH